MLVDDEPAILKALMRELGAWSRANQHQILSFTSAKDALAAINRQNGGIDLLVTDLRMPEMGGSDLLQRVKERWPDVPAILLTGFADTVEISRAMRSGLLGFILKPWQPGSLIDEFEKALAHVGAPKAREHHEGGVHAELELAGKISRLILDVPPIAECPVDFTILTRPFMQGCAGDYYDVARLSDDRVMLAIGEFPGHGTIGSLGVCFLKSAVGSQLAASGPQVIELGAFMQGIGVRLRGIAKETAGKGVTLTVVAIDTEKMTMDWVSAGSLPVFLMQGGSCDRLWAPQPALGTSGDVDYHVSTVSLSHGCGLLLCTDGLTHVGKAQRDGISRLCHLAAHWEPPDLSRLCSMVLADSGASEFTDDVTIVHATIPWGSP